MIEFVRDEEGFYSHRIDGFEVSIDLKGGSEKSVLHINLYGTEELFPCEEDDLFPSDVCKKGKCDYTASSSCPHSTTEETLDESSMIWGEDLLMLAKEFRRMVTEGDDGIGHKKNWPEEARLIASDLEWIMK